MFHHRTIKNLSSGSRRRIKQVVDESWTELLQCAKNLIDAHLEDGEKCISTFLILFRSTWVLVEN